MADKVEAKKSIEERILAAMADVTHVEKTGQNASQNYKYVEIAEVKRAVREAMLAHGIIYTARHEVKSTAEVATRSGGILHVVTTESVFRFTAADNPSSYVEVQTIGSGSDSGDKAPYKAMTGAEKYALMQTFAIPAGDDAEVDSHERSAPKQSGRPVSIAKPSPAQAKPSPAQAKPAPSGEWELIEVKKAFAPASGTTKTGKSWSRFDFVSRDEQKFSTFDHDIGALLEDGALLEIMADEPDNYGKRKVHQARLSTVVSQEPSGADHWDIDEEEAV